jgi:HK97 family phage major capsid protein
MKTGRIIEVLSVLLLGLAAYAAWQGIESMLLAAGCLCATAPLVLTEEQAREFQGILGELRSGWGDVRGLPATVQALQTEQGNLRDQLDQVRRCGLARFDSGTRPVGGVSDGCARHLAAGFIAHCERSGKLEALCSSSHQRDAMMGFARQTLDMSTRAALTPGDIPLPAQYSGEFRELISEFGVARRRMMRYPIGLGTARPARLGTRPAFGSIAMSAAIGEKSPTFDFASLESHKIGGIVRVPRELDEQSIVPMGQFLARYGAIEFARAEDTWAFLSDGTGTYENVKGVVRVARENGRSVILAAGKTKPSDATLDDFRGLRTKVNKAALNGKLSAYYLDSTWEARLPSFRTAAEPNVYQRLPDGSAVLDGYPVIWTDVLEPYGTAAAADKPLAVFGALSLWWMGEHGSPRMDQSEHVWFANDQLAVRFIEEIDFDYAAIDAASVLLTPAA